MYIDNQKNSDQRRFTGSQHSKNEESLYGGSPPISPVAQVMSFESQQKYMLSPGSEGSQGNKQIEANPQDDMQCQKLQESGQEIGGSKIQQEQASVISTKNVLKLEDDQVLQLQTYLQSKGLPSQQATLQVRVIPEISSEDKCIKKLQLDKKDLENVFPRYGKTTNIEVDNELGRGLITFDNFLDAFKAKLHLNGHKLPKDKAVLEVIFVQLEPKKVEPVQPKQEEVKQQLVFQTQQPVQNQPQFFYQPPQFQTMPNSMPANLAMASPFTPSMQLPKSPKRQKAYYEVYDPYQTEEDQGVKYTCRYDIQIDNEKEFQVARRVIGSKGANMKRIIEECSEGFDKNVNPYEIVKLRLRGKGSGFKEGQNQMESDDPLNLCISSKYKEKYEYACSEMEILIKQVYEQFKTFYRYKQRKPLNWGQDLKISKEETVTRPKVIEEYGEEEEEVTVPAASYNPVINQFMNNQFQNQQNQMGMNSFQPQNYNIQPQWQQQQPFNYSSFSNVGPQAFSQNYVPKTEGSMQYNNTNN